MCIICTGEYKTIENLTTLVCSGCTLTEIPVIPGLKYLYCAHCPSLTEIPIIPGLKELYCLGCTLTEIPVIPGLQYLDCSWSTSLTKISIIPGLRELYCFKCTSLTEIPIIEGLKILNCSWCTLKEIPVIPGLKELYCYECTSLTEIPNSPDLQTIGYYSCPWLSKNPYFEENLEKLIFLQKKLRRRYVGKKLETLIPEVSEIYYSPGCKGYELAKRSFYSST